jgi:hypothetical protein
LQEKCGAGFEERGHVNPTRHTHALRTIFTETYLTWFLFVVICAYAQNKQEVFDMKVCFPVEKTRVSQAVSPAISDPLHCFFW